MSWTVYPWSRLQVGESAVVRGRTIGDANRARWHAYRRPSCRGKKFRARTKYDGGIAIGVLIWRVK